MVRDSRARFFSLASATVFLFSLGACAADSCQPVFDALTKIVTTPSHSFTTHTSPFLKEESHAPVKQSTRRERYTFAPTGSGCTVE